jgi:hypothetical protein
MRLLIPRRSRPVAPDEAAGEVGISRKLAAFHLDRLVERGPLTARYARQKGRPAPVSKTSSILMMNRASLGATLGDGVVGGLVAAVASGLPSTLHALLTGGDVLQSSRAAGSLVAPAPTGSGALVAAAVPVHFAISLTWGVVLAGALPSEGTVAAGALAGTLIAALDLGVIGRRFDRIRALPLVPQLADHVVFGAVAAAVIARRRRRRTIKERRQPL